MKESPQTVFMGTLLSRSQVRVYVYELPRLSEKERISALKYKLRATVPIVLKDEALLFRSFIKNHQNFGVIFWLTEELSTLTLVQKRTLRVSYPFLISSRASEVLWFVSSAFGIDVHYYYKGILNASFGPFAVKDPLLNELYQRYPNAEIAGSSLDEEYPLPELPEGRSWNESLKKAIMKSLPFLFLQPTSKVPQLAGITFAIIGIFMISLGVVQSIKERQARNGIWQTAIQNMMMKSPLQQKRLEKAFTEQGIPIPDFFSHLAIVWPTGTKILHFSWTQKHWSLTCEANSALVSLKELTSDPWFKDIHISSIIKLNSGEDEFIVQGTLTGEP